MSLQIDGPSVTGMWFDGEGPDPARLDAVVIDGSGATIVPGLVDSHAHLSMPGGARWIERGFDAADELLVIGEENGEAMVRAGIRWVGAHDRPYVRAARMWITRSGSLPHGPRSNSSTVPTWPVPWRRSSTTAPTR